jgi:hypothetical protein
MLTYADVCKSGQRADGYRYRVEPAKVAFGNPSTSYNACYRLRQYMQSHGLVPQHRTHSLPPPFLPPAQPHPEGPCHSRRKNIKRLVLLLLRLVRLSICAIRYVSIRQETLRQHTAAFVSIRHDESLGLVCQYCRLLCQYLYFCAVKQVN